MDEHSWNQAGTHGRFGGLSRHVAACIACLLVPVALASTAVTLPDGTRAELVGLTQTGDGEARWWRPNGAPMETPGDWTEPEAEERGRRRTMVAECRVTYAPGAVTWFAPDLPPFTRGRVHLFGQSGATATGGDVLPDGGEKTYRVQWDVDGAAQGADLIVRLGTTPNVVLETVGADGKTLGANLAAKVARKEIDFIAPFANTFIGWTPPAEVDGRSFIAAVHALPDVRTRVVAVDTNGKQHLPGAAGAGFSTGSSTDAFSIAWGGFAPSPENIERYELHGQPLRTLRFEHLALTPDAATEPTARDAADDGPGPADRTIREALRFDGESIADALEKVADAAGVAVTVDWEAFDPQSELGREMPVRPLGLQHVTPRTAICALVESAGGRDFAVVVSPDGRTLRVVRGTYHTLRADGRPVSARETR